MKFLHLRAVVAAARSALPWALLLLTLLAWAEPALADMGDAYKTIGSLEDTIVQRVNTVVNGPEVGKIVRTFFIVLAMSLFIMKAVSWALRGFHLADFFETMMQIGVPAVTLVTFTTLMPAMFNASLAIGQALLVGITSTLDTPVKDTNAASVIVDMIVNYGKSLSLGCSLSVWNLFGILDCIKGMVVGLVALIIISILGVVLCAAIMFVDVWGFWVYAVALASGKLLIPFAMYKRLQFLADGWLKFMLGNLVYIVVARANLALAAFAIATALKSPGNTSITAITDILKAGAMFSTQAAMLFMFTGKAATQIAGSSAGAGFNFGALIAGAQTAARKAGKAAGRVAAVGGFLGAGFKGAGARIAAAKLAKAEAAKKAAEKAKSASDKMAEKMHGLSAPKSAVEEARKNALKVPGLNFGEVMKAGFTGAMGGYKGQLMKDRNFASGYRWSNKLVKDMRQRKETEGNLRVGGWDAKDARAMARDQYRIARGHMTQKQYDKKWDKSRKGRDAHMRHDFNQGLMAGGLWISEADLASMKEDSRAVAGGEMDRNDFDRKWDQQMRAIDALGHDNGAQMMRDHLNVLHGRMSEADYQNRWGDALLEARVNAAATLAGTDDVVAQSIASVAYREEAAERAQEEFDARFEAYLDSERAHIANDVGLSGSAGDLHDLYGSYAHASGETPRILYGDVIDPRADDGSHGEQRGPVIVEAGAGSGAVDDNAFALPAEGESSAPRVLYGDVIDPRANDSDHYGDDRGPVIVDAGAGSGAIEDDAFGLPAAGESWASPSGEPPVVSYEHVVDSRPSGGEQSPAAIAAAEEHYMLPAEGGSSASHQEESRGGGFSSESEPSVEEQHRTLNYNEWAASIRKKKGGSGQGSSGSGSRAA